jgi:hypothetical protein
MRRQASGVVTAWVLGALGILGCGGDPANETNTYFYRGSNETRSPDGQSIGSGETLLRRVFDGPRNQIIEHVITRDAQQGTQENTLTFAVTGSTFKDEAAGITGELVGEPWEWTRWTARTTLPNGLALESISTIDEDAVTIDMTFRSGDAVQFTLKHSITAISQSNFEQQRAQWVSQ